MCVFLISPVPIAEPLTSELIDTPVFYNLAPRPIKYRVSVPIPTLGAGRMTHGPRPLCLNETRSPAKSPCLPPCQRPSSLSRHIPWDGTHGESELRWITPLSFPSKQNKVAVLVSLGCGKRHYWECWMSFPTVNQTNTLRRLQPTWSVRSSISNIKHICL